MSGLFLTSLTGLRAQRLRLDMVANNLANMSTTGFKAARVDLADLPRQPLEAARAGAPIELGSGVILDGTTRSFIQGGLQMTDRPLDLAILGIDAFIQVTLSGGETAYTRAGNLSLDATGRLVTAAGDPLSPPVTIQPGATITAIGPDGSIMGIVPGSTVPQQIGTLQLARFPNAQGLSSIGSDYFIATDAAGAPQVGTPGQNGFPAVGSGMLESSNVDLAEQMTTMIEAQRAYSMNLRAVQTMDEMIGAVIQTRT